MSLRGATMPEITSRCPENSSERPSTKPRGDFIPSRFYSSCNHPFAALRSTLATTPWIIASERTCPPTQNFMATEVKSPSELFALTVWRPHSKIALPTKEIG